MEEVVVALEHASVVGMFPVDEEFGQIKSEFLFAGDTRAGTQIPLSWSGRRAISLLGIIGLRPNAVNKRRGNSDTNDQRTRCRIV